MKAITYAYVEAETTFDQLGAAIGDALPQLQKAAAGGKLRPAGPFVIRAFAWKHTAPPGMSASSTDRWVGDDRREWGFVVTDADGKTMLELDATSVRRK